jgi:hypothetical protein
MFNRFAVSFIAMSFALAGAASATDIKHKVEVPGDASKVWSQIGGWCAISDWHPAIAKCEESKDGNTLRRTLTTKDGGVIKETMTKQGPTSYSYKIDESPLPVSDYTATFAVSQKKKKQGQVNVLWSAKFTPKGKEADAKKVMDGILSSGLDQIKTKVK